MFENKLEQFLYRKFKLVSDFQIHEVTSYRIFYLSSLVNLEDLNTYIMKPLVQEDLSIEKLPTVSLKQETSLDVAESELLRGSVIVSNKSIKNFSIVTIPSDIGRGIEPSEQESTLYTSQSSFTEQLDQNVTLVRRILPISDLKLEYFTVGNLTKSKVAVLYLESLSDHDEVDIIRKKLKHLNVDFLTNSPFLGRLLGSSNSNFPEFQLSDRPDFVGLSLSKGKIVILVDQNPFA
ncbi:spore germination protein, partial [Metabacillus sp. YM-086]|uniref:spore germination protein n=1 Tax=Metabacillus sp. YM-086 TaxID=3341729 RepID=UPI003A8841A1